MTQKEVYLTPEGLEKLKAELEHLETVRRPQIADQIHRAKELGGTVDNAEYDDAKNEQAFVEGRIMTLENMIKNATLIEEEKSPSKFIKIGSKVAVNDPEGEEEHFTIVGSAEAGPGEGRISNESPVGGALLGRKMGDKVRVVTPDGTVTFKVLAIE